jgi:hypothetical protein
MTVKSLSRSSLVNNRWYENMLAGNAAYAVYELLETVIVTSAGQTSLTFSNLNSIYSSTYQHLQIRAVVQTTRASSLDALRLQFNGDTGANYSFHYIQGGNPPSVISSNATNASNIFLGYLPGASNSTSWAPNIVDILDPFETTKHKVTRCLNGQVDPNWQTNLFTSGAWRNNNAITSIELKPDVGPNFSIGTRVSLYGMRSS